MQGVGQLQRVSGTTFNVDQRSPVADGAAAAATDAASTVVATRKISLHSTGGELAARSSTNYRFYSAFVGVYLLCHF
jgi:hypothetical protein